MKNKIKVILLVLTILPISLLTAVLLFLKNNPTVSEELVAPTQEINLSQEEYERLILSLEPRAATSSINGSDEYLSIINSLTQEGISGNSPSPELLEKIKAN